MEKSKNNKAINALAITLFTVVRVIMFSYFPNVSDKTPYVVFGVLLAAFAVLTSVLFIKASEKCEGKADLLLALMLADFFFTLQNNSVILLVSLLWEAYALLSLSEKKTPAKEISLFAVSFVSAMLKPYTAFSFVLLAAVAYLVLNRKKAPVKAAVCAVLAVACGVSGFAVNGLVLEKNSEFTFLINQYTLGADGARTALNIAVFVPVAVVAALLLVMMIVFSKNEAKEAGRETVFCVVGSIILCGVSLAGLLLNQFDMYMVINQITPVILVAMLLNKNSVAEKTFGRINSFVSSHPLVAVIIFVAVFGVQVYCLDAIGLGGEIRGLFERQVY